MFAFLSHFLFSRQMMRLATHGTGCTSSPSSSLALSDFYGRIHGQVAWKASCVWGFIRIFADKVNLRKRTLIQIDRIAALDLDICWYLASVKGKHVYVCEFRFGSLLFVLRKTLENSTYLDKIKRLWKTLIKKNTFRNKTWRCSFLFGYNLSAIKNNTEHYHRPKLKRGQYWAVYDRTKD